MITTLQEASAGASQATLTEALVALGENPDDFTVYPFVKEPYLENKTTGKTFIIAELLEGDGHAN